MVVRNFDRKFGAQFLESLPGSAGVYLVYDQKAELIYVGKALNLKRRLSQYRNTLRRKKHLRMRGIVKEAARIEIQCAETHLDACLTETMLIQKHRPRWNIVGAYSFLYPLIGIRSANGNIEFCMTTTPEAVLKECPGFEFHGAFRSRRITGDGFFALMRLLRFAGHVNPSKRRNGIPRYSYIFSFRRLPQPSCPRGVPARIDRHRGRKTRCGSEFLRGGDRPEICKADRSAEGTRARPGPSRQ